MVRAERENMRNRKDPTNSVPEKKQKSKHCLMFCKIIIIKGILMTLKEFNAVKKIACAIHKKILFGYFLLLDFFVPTLRLLACQPCLMPLCSWFLCVKILYYV